MSASGDGATVHVICPTCGKTVDASTIVGGKCAECARSAYMARHPKRGGARRRDSRR